MTIQDDSVQRLVQRTKRLLQDLDSSGLELVYVCSGTSTSAYIREQGSEDNHYGQKITDTNGEGGSAIGGQICP